MDTPQQVGQQAGTDFAITFSEFIEKILTTLELGHVELSNGGTISVLTYFLTFELILFGILVSMGKLQAFGIETVWKLLGLSVIWYFVQNSMALSVWFRNFMLEYGNVAVEGMSQGVTLQYTVGDLIENPSALMAEAELLVLQLSDSWLEVASSLNIVKYALSAICALASCFMIYVGFLIIVLTVTMARIEFGFAVLFGTMLLPFTVFKQTKFIGDKVYGIIVNNSVKLMVLGVTASLGLSVLKGTYDNAGNLTNTFLILIAFVPVYIILWIVKRAEAIATSLVSGAPALSGSTFASGAVGAVAGMSAGVGGVLGSSLANPARNLTNRIGSSLARSGPARMVNGAVMKARSGLSNGAGYVKDGVSAMTGNLSGGARKSISSTMGSNKNGPLGGMKGGSPANKNLERLRRDHAMKKSINVKNMDGSAIKNADGSKLTRGSKEQPKSLYRKIRKATQDYSSSLRNEYGNELGVKRPIGKNGLRTNIKDIANLKATKLTSDTKKLFEKVDAKYVGVDAYRKQREKNKQKMEKRKIDKE